VIVGPSSTITDTTPTFSWRHSGSSFRYELLIRDLLNNEDINHQVTTFSLDPGGATASYTLPAANALKAGTYRFWVRAFNSLGQASGWSTSVTFVITVQLDENLQKPPIESPEGLEQSQLALALTTRKVMPVNKTDDVAMPAEVVVAEADYVSTVQWPTETHTPTMPAVPVDESLIDAFMHRIADPSSDADFTFLRS
jgi:hypothetical protein